MSRAPQSIAVALGDPGGIGPEVALKAIAAEFSSDSARYRIIGSADLLCSLNEELKLSLPISRSAAADARILIEDSAETGAAAVLRQPGTPEAARAALTWLQHGARLCLAGEADALVTAPVNKESIIRSGEPDFVGQTELLSALGKTTRTAMMLLGYDDRGRWLRVALATIHIPIAKVAASLTQPKIELAIELASKACHDLQLPRARVGVCGLNPHAGEGGKIGTEELTTVIPAVKAAQSRGFDVVGPLAADTLFYYAFRGDFDAVVAMYHDQGLAPLKMIGFETGVNWTLGLPFIRTSPDHGTAYDIAGRGVANPSSMIAALRLAKALAARRTLPPRTTP
jgi:4-hydroxythreonine-4-phosphate dehydrogenase